MPKEYIEREAAITELVELTMFEDAAALNRYVEAAAYREHGWVGGIRDSLVEIGGLPAADVVEVVRCRECIYWRGENDICKGICIDFSADGYCSEGKRMDGGQEPPKEEL